MSAHELDMAAAEMAAAKREVEDVHAVVLAWVKGLAEAGNEAAAHLAARIDAAFDRMDMARSYAASLVQEEAGRG